MYNSGISVRDIYTDIITRCHEVTQLVLFLADPHNNVFASKVISEENRAVVTLASSLSDQAMILSNTIIHRIMKSKSEKFQEILSVLCNESLTSSVVETMQSVFYHGVSIRYGWISEISLCKLPVSTDVI